MFTFGVRAHDYGRYDVDELFKTISKDGWSHTQLAYQKAVQGVNSLNDITSSVLQETIEALEKYNMFVSVFGCYIEPSYVDENLRKSNVDTFIQCIPFAKKLGALCIGTETTNMDKQPNVSRKEALYSLEKSLEEMLTVAQEHDVTVAIEPVFYHAMSTPEITKNILDTMRSKNLKVIFDPVNLLSPQEIPDQKSLWDRSMDAFANEIVAVHMKGAKADGDKILSVPYKDSVVNYQYIFGELKKLKQDLPILREEVKPENALTDMEFLKKLTL